jgi:hypothetical protein
LAVQAKKVGTGALRLNNAGCRQVRRPSRPGDNDIAIAIDRDGPYYIRIATLQLSNEVELDLAKGSAHGERRK